MTLLDQATTLRELAGRRRRAHVIAITSGKGGVGKSNIAVNLATQFSAAGKDVLLFDADLGLANADVLCNVEVPFNLSHVMINRKTLHDVMVKTPAGFRLIGGASGLANMADLSNQQRERLVNSLEMLEEQADIILVDTGAGISPNVLCFTRAADEVIVVTTPEPTAITDAYAVIKVLSRQGYEHPRLSLLVNQCRFPGEARLVYERISRVARQFLNVSIYDAGHVMHDEAVSLAVRRRTPFLLATPHCPASVCITQLAGRLHKGLAPPQRQTSFFLRVSKWFWR
jgi:flagellar biosynthesis protein FlhG